MAPPLWSSGTVVMCTQIRTSSAYGGTPSGPAQGGGLECTVLTDRGSMPTSPAAGGSGLGGTMAIGGVSVESRLDSKGTFTRVREGGASTGTGVPAV